MKFGPCSALPAHSLALHTCQTKGPKQLWLPYCSVLRGRRAGDVGAIEIAGHRLQNLGQRFFRPVCCCLIPETRLAPLPQPHCPEYRGEESLDSKSYPKVLGEQRARLIAAFIFFVLFVQKPVASSADDPAVIPGLDEQAISTAVQSGVRHLISLQHDDGSIHDRGHETAMTALSVMAMASIGIQPSDPGPPGMAMRRAIDYVVSPPVNTRQSRQDAQGYFGRADGSRMYGHGIITLMLTEMVGMGADAKQDQQIRTALDAAIGTILAAQAVRKPPAYQGGWRYAPDSNDADLSVSVWQLMALRSAKNDDMAVPGEAIDQAVEYLRRSYTSPLDQDGKPRDAVAGFSYTPGQNHPTYTMTAAGLLAMQVCGQYDSPLVIGASDWLLEHSPDLDERFFYYGTYYYAQGMHQRGGKHATEAANKVSRVLLKEQNANGSWASQRGEERNYGDVYATSLAVLSLSVTYHYLPIYQR